MSEIIISEEIKGNGAIIKLGESLSGGSQAMTFQTRLNELVSNGIKKIAVNLEDVKIINSSGLGMIVSAHSTIRKDGASLVIANLPEKVKELIEMTHLDKVLKISEDINSALN